MFDHAASPLSLLETRVLGVLIEKRATTPDSYPLTLNALVSGCNQKTSRDPVLEASEAEVRMAVDALKRANLVIESSGGRVARFEHNTARVLGLDAAAVALLAVLMLRGPQTPGELRIGGERLHAFADIAAVEALLEDLMTRPGSPFVARLPRQPGSREARYAQLLGGPVAAAGSETVVAERRAVEDISVSEIAALKAGLAQLREEFGALRATVDKIYADLGLKR